MHPLHSAAPSQILRVAHLDQYCPVTWAPYAFCAPGTAADHCDSAQVCHASPPALTCYAPLLDGAALMLLEEVLASQEIPLHCQKGRLKCLQRLDTGEAGLQAYCELRSGEECDRALPTCVVH